MMNRVYSIAADEVPKFENLRQTKSGSMEPIELFLEWKEIVKNYIK